MSLSVTIAFWGVSSWIPPYVSSIATTAGLPGPRWAALAGLTFSSCGIIGYFTFGFLADTVGRKPITMLFYLLCLMVTPVVYLWAHGIYVLLLAVGISGFFILGIFAWLPIWLPELFPTRMRATAAAFCFNAPRFVSCIGPLIAGTLTVGLGGYGPAATIVGLFYILGLAAAPFLPETKGQPLPETISPRASPALRRRALTR
jgi:MFS family permease